MKKCCKNCIRFGYSYLLNDYTNKPFCNYDGKKIMTYEDSVCDEFMPINATIKRVSGVLTIITDNIQLELNFHE